MATMYYRDPDTGNWLPLTTAGAAGAAGPDEVIVSATEPVASNIELWVAPGQFLGGTGWDGFDDRYINTTGDAMTGALSMGTNRITNVGTATAAGDAMSRAAGDARYVLLSGAGQTISGAVTFSGTVTLAGDPTAALGAATKQYVDGRVVISSTAPASPTVGLLWATP